MNFRILIPSIRHVNELLKMEGEEVHHIGVIKVNPEQSKHLETAKMRVYHTWVDFVNLRAEAYAENSRIPTMVHDIHRIIFF